MGSEVFSLMGPLAGGLGLFLLGMSMMTDGLKLAAGPAASLSPSLIMPMPSRNRPSPPASGPIRDKAPSTIGGPAMCKRGRRPEPQGRPPMPQSG